MSRPRHVLFIHGNFPGQFRNLAAMCGGDPAFQVAYLTAHDHPNKWRIKGVNVQTYELHRQVNPGTHQYVRPVEDAVLRGQALLRSLHALLLSGFRPDVVVFHAGSGLGLFLRDLLPDVELIGYFEWYFVASTSQYLFRDFQMDQQLGLGIRNLPTERELLLADVCIVPTEWQYSQFPDLYRQKLTVQFDGIDTSFFHPREPGVLRTLTLPLLDRTDGVRIEPDDLLLTYATRGMEPLRGFPEFMRALPDLLSKLPRLKVVIAGDDRQAYSYAAPTHDGSWKQAMLAELGDCPGSERILFTGSLTYQDYRELLWRSDLHCYFTRPYVTSWSLFEAVACATPLCLNRNGATEIFINRARALIDLDDTPAHHAEAILKALVGVPPQPTDKFLEHTGLPDPYGLPACIQQWRRLLAGECT